MKMEKKKKKKEREKKHENSKNPSKNKNKKQTNNQTSKQYIILSHIMFIDRNKSETIFEINVLIYRLGLTTNHNNSNNNVLSYSIDINSHTYRYIITTIDGCVCHCLALTLARVGNGGQSCTRTIHLSYAYAGNCSRRCTNGTQIVSL